MIFASMSILSLADFNPFRKEFCFSQFKYSGMSLIFKLFSKFRIFQITVVQKCLNISVIIEKEVSRSKSLYVQK